LLNWYKKTKQEKSLHGAFNPTHHSSLFKCPIKQFLWYIQKSCAIVLKYQMSD